MAKELVKKIPVSEIVGRIRRFIEQSAKKKGVYVETEAGDEANENEIVIRCRGRTATIRYDNEYVHVVLVSTLSPLSMTLKVGHPLTVFDYNEVDDALAKLMRTRYKRLRLVRCCFYVISRNRYTMT